MNPHTLPIDSCQKKAAILVVDIVLIPRRPVGAREDAPPYPPHPGRNGGGANGNDDEKSVFRLFHSNRICSANLLECSFRMVGAPGFGCCLGE